VSLALFILLTRIAHPRFSVLGRVVAQSQNDDKEMQRHIYVPIEHPSIRTTSELDPLPPGVVVVRLEESYTYPNAAYLTDRIIDAAKAVTRRGAPPPETNGARNWNDSGKGDIGKEKYPLLRAVVVDFACVSIFDSTALQGLTVARSSLDRYTGHSVEWHFANIADASIRRALMAGGFGGETPSVTSTESLPVVPVLSTPQYADANSVELLPTTTETPAPPKFKDLHNTTFFHYDLDEAVSAASRAPTPEIDLESSNGVNRAKLADSNEISRQDIGGSNGVTREGRTDSIGDENANLNG